MNFEVDNNEILILSTTACYDDIINIYEFTYKCKNWAKNKGYFIESDNMGECRVHLTDESGWIMKKEIEFIEGSEVESIFKACEWIIEREEND